MLNDDPVWDFEMQVSQQQTILHGCGPLFWMNPYTVLPRSALCGDLLVPERTKADASYWEVAALRFNYYPPELYEFIMNEKAATAAGWGRPVHQERHRERDGHRAGRGLDAGPRVLAVRTKNK